VVSVTSLWPYTRVSRPREVLRLQEIEKGCKKLYKENIFYYFNGRWHMCAVTKLLMVVSVLVQSAILDKSNKLIKGRPWSAGLR
jgi:hypothetical protein